MKITLSYGVVYSTCFIAITNICVCASRSDLILYILTTTRVVFLHIMFLKVHERDNSVDLLRHFLEIKTIITTTIIANVIIIIDIIVTIIIAIIIVIISLKLCFLCSLHLHQNSLHSFFQKVFADRIQILQFGSFGIT